MSTRLTRQEGLEKLRDVLAFPKLDLARVIEAGRSVRERYQPMFTPDNLPKLTEADFLSAAANLPRGLAAASCLSIVSSNGMRSRVGGQSSPLL